MLVEYVKAELERVGDMYDGMVNKAVIDIAEKFSEQGHSGGSAMLVVQILEKVLRFRPLTPLTGEDDEWMEVEDGLFQNKRCPSVFKDAERAWDIDLPPENADDVSITQRWRTINFPYEPGDKPGKESSSEMSSRAAPYMQFNRDTLMKLLNSGNVNEITNFCRDVASMAASVVSQDQTKGQG